MVRGAGSSMASEFCLSVDFSESKGIGIEVGFSGQSAILNAGNSGAK